MLVQLGKYGPAIRELTRALNLKADDRSARINLAVAYEQSNDHQKSLALFRPLDRNVASPLPASVVIFYIRALAATQQTELALKRTQAAVAAAPENSVLHDTLGSLEAQRQDWNGAIEQFKEAIRLDSNFADAHFHLGLALMVQRQTSEALPELMKTAELSPQNALAQVELAKALIANDENEKAIPALQHTLDLAPTYLDAKYQLALALQATGQEQKAIPLFQDVVVSRSAKCAGTDQSWSRACPDREIQRSDPAIPARHQGNSRRSFGASGSGGCLPPSERPG